MAQAAKPSNGFNGEQLQGYIERIEERHAEIASVMGTAVRECKTIRDDIKDIYTEAKDKGVPTKALKAQVKLRQLDQDKAKVIAGLDGDDEDALERIMEALGDFASDAVSETFLKGARESAGASN